VILLWGIATDDPLAAVGAALDLRGSPYMFVDQMAAAETDIELQVKESVTGHLAIQGEGIALEDVRAAYLRPYDTRRVVAARGIGNASDLWQRAAAVDETLGVWAEVTPALMVNRPSNMASNGSKPYQMQLIRALGFRVPPTLVTTDQHAALEFLELYGEVVYKSVSGVRSIVARLGSDRIRDLGDVANCPTQFQAYIPGRDYRVHIIGEDVFVSEVETAADDYRYASRNGRSVAIRASCVPSDLEDACRELTAALGLVAAGIDLRVTPEGEWYCFEVNPSPGFTFYEAATGQEIAASMARLLAAAD
jgi:glutathione synthase/RimK-type ligase-like ATP-grasp enzyme